VVGRVHDAEGAERRVEGVVGEGQRERFAGEPLDAGVAGREREQRRFEVHADDPGRPARGRRQRGVAGPARHVEHRLARANVAASTIASATPAMSYN
jgi:hypothetical protein